MNQETKDAILARTKKHIAFVQARIAEALELTGRRSSQMKQDIKSMEGPDRMVQQVLLAYSQKQLDDLEQLEPSPYFARLLFNTPEENREIYIGKFSFTEEKIYSWVTPVAALRFESPGPASYTRPNGSIKSGTIEEKDQCMIVDGKLMFLATEHRDKPRELVYQEHFTRTKKGFVLQDVVEQMEKAQDQIIRADHHGPLLISGPAGSGKTTLALHRVAYLLQSPETQSLFPPERILVLVQDAGTKAYFSSLLPDLGIKGVDIQTFSEWALGILGLHNVRFSLHIATNEQDAYEYAKLQALRQLPDVTFSRAVFPVLKKVYANVFSAQQQQWFDTLQRKQGIVDRIDLTILLELYKKKYGAFEFEKEYYQQKADGSYTKKKGKFPASYDLFIIDEFQNYLPEQLNILMSCSSKRVQSVIFVGDMNQQTLLGTVSDWNQVAVSLSEERKVLLQKVYRNTQHILRYISALGYAVDIPVQLTEGEHVEEELHLSPEAEFQAVCRYVDKQQTGAVGILAKDIQTLEQYKTHFASHDQIHCLTFQETQGVEFETVCLVGITRDLFDLSAVPEEIREEKKKIQRDLLYVALTRAMNRMRVFGTCPLKEACQILFSD